MDNQPASNSPSQEAVQKTTSPQPSVPSTPPPSPIQQFKDTVRPPYLNLMILAFVILLGGFMTYNFVVHQLTQLAGDATQRAPSASVTPSMHPTPTKTSAPTPTTVVHERKRWQ